MTYRLSSLFLLLFVLFSGCGGPAKPADFPKLVRPVTIKIHKDGTPLSGVMVSLHPKDTTLPFNISGLTGADGVATLQTSRNTYIKAGAPVGIFLVQLTEMIEVDMSNFKGEVQKKVLEGIELDIPASSRAFVAWEREYDRRADVLRKIPKALTNDKSPLEIGVTSSMSIEFDVAKY